MDFGRIVAGFVELDLEAPAGTVVDMHYREKVFRPELAWSGEDPETGARYVAAGTGDQFAALEINGLRYLHLAIHADEAVSVTLNRLEMREYLYPRTGGAYFSSDDPRLDALYRGRHPHCSAQLARLLHRLPDPRAARLGGRRRCASNGRPGNEPRLGASAQLSGVERLSAPRRHPSHGCCGRYRGERRPYHPRLVAQLDPRHTHSVLA